jgi:hypothetical protein
MSDDHTPDLPLAEILSQLARVVANIEKRVGAIEAQPRQSTPAVFFHDDHSQVVTLDQIAARMRMSKRSLERYKKEMPPPVMRGRRGRTSRWVWADVRPWLEQTFGCVLPERFPVWSEQGGRS